MSDRTLIAPMSVWIERLPVETIQSDPHGRCRFAKSRVEDCESSCGGRESMARPSQQQSQHSPWHVTGDRKLDMGTRLLERG